MAKADANDPFERWRFMELGIASANRRLLIGKSPLRDPSFAHAGGDVPQRLTKAADKVSGETAKSLYEHSRPANLIEEVILYRQTSRLIER